MRLRAALARAGLTAALLVAAAPALAGQAVDMRANPVASDAKVTLGDLFDDAGDAADVAVAPGPRVGGTVVLDAGRVQAIARAHGLDWANSSGWRRVVVRSGGAAPAPTVAAASPAAATAGQKTVETLTYVRSLAAGEIVRPEDVVWSKVQAHLTPGDAPRDAETVIGQAARRPLREGAAVSLHDLSSPQVIRKDQVIDVAYQIDGVNLVLQARALGNATVGEPVQVLNTQSKKTIEAVASGPGRAVVGPEAETLKARSFAALR